MLSLMAIFFVITFIVMIFGYSNLAAKTSLPIFIIGAVWLPYSFIYMMCCNDTTQRLQKMEDDYNKGGL